MTTHATTGVEPTGTDDSIEPQTQPPIFGVGGRGLAHHHDVWNDRGVLYDGAGEVVEQHDLDNEANGRLAVTEGTA